MRGGFEKFQRLIAVVELRSSGSQHFASSSGSSAAPGESDAQNGYPTFSFSERREARALNLKPFRCPGAKTTGEPSPAKPVVRATPPCPGLSPLP